MLEQKLATHVLISTISGTIVYCYVCYSPWHCKAGMNQIPDFVLSALDTAYASECGSASLSAILAAYSESGAEAPALESLRHDLAATGRALAQDGVRLAATLRQEAGAVQPMLIANASAAAQYQRTLTAAIQAGTRLHAADQAVRAHDQAVVGAAAEVMASHLATHSQVPLAGPAATLPDLHKTWDQPSEASQDSIVAAVLHGGSGNAASPELPSVACAQQLARWGAFAQAVCESSTWLASSDAHACEGQGRLIAAVYRALCQHYRSTFPPGVVALACAEWTAVLAQHTTKRVRAAFTGAVAEASAAVAQACADAQPAAADRSEVVHIPGPAPALAATARIAPLADPADPASKAAALRAASAVPEPGEPARTIACAANYAVSARALELAQVGRKCVDYGALALPALTHVLQRGISQWQDAMGFSAPGAREGGARTAQVALLGTVLELPLPSARDSVPPRVPPAAAIADGMHLACALVCTECAAAPALATCVWRAVSAAAARAAPAGAWSGAAQSAALRGARAANADAMLTAMRQAVQATQDACRGLDKLPGASAWLWAALDGTIASVLRAAARAASGSQPVSWLAGSSPSSAAQLQATFAHDCRQLLEEATRGCWEWTVGQVQLTMAGGDVASASSLILPRTLDALAELSS